MLINTLEILCEQKNDLLLLSHSVGQTHKPAFVKKKEKSHGRLQLLTGAEKVCKQPVPMETVSFHTAKVIKCGQIVKRVKEILKLL